MTDEVNYRCNQHPDPFDCPDCIIHYIPKFDEYGIMVRDGGSSSMLIFFCPFCGAQLPKSKRDLWFEKLGVLGISEPSKADLPKKFKTDEWFRKKSGNKRIEGIGM